MDDDAKLIRREAPDDVTAAQFVFNRPAHRSDHFVADVEPERLVDHRHVVDGSNEKRARLLIDGRFVDHRRRRFHEANAIELAGQLIAVTAKQKTLFLKVALVDDSDDAARIEQFAFGRKPDSSLILEP